MAYYHTTLLFLIRNYTYYPYWDESPHPLLSPEETQSHVGKVLRLTGSILSHGNSPGVLLLFPLRVAGSLAGNMAMKRQIVACLDSIFWKGFVVTEQVKLDLQQFWTFHGLEYRQDNKPLQGM